MGVHDFGRGPPIHEGEQRLPPRPARSAFAVYLLTSRLAYEVERDLEQRSGTPYR